MGGEMDIMNCKTLSQNGSHY